MSYLVSADGFDTVQINKINSGDVECWKIGNRKSALFFFENKLVIILMHWLWKANLQIKFKKIPSNS